MMIETFAVAVAVALVVGTVALAVDLSSMWIPALLKRLDLPHRDLTLAFGGSRFGRGLPRSDEPDGSRVVATDSALEAEQKRLADLKAELRKLTVAQRERTEAAGELAKQEAALAQRERILERSLADAERSAAEATARIEAREAVLATQEAELQQQESELADRHQSLAERELIRARAVLRPPDEGLGAAESDWWEKQLGRPLSAAELKAQAKALG
jgi:chromosome segregation ATPase